MNFLRKLYWSIGETLPHEKLVHTTNTFYIYFFPVDIGKFNQVGFPTILSLFLLLWKYSETRMKFDPRNPLSTERGRAKLVDVLLETSMGGSTRMTQTGPENLPRRYLPPGRYTDLFRLYTAECIAHRRPMASSTTFFRVLRESGWRQVLRFRGLVPMLNAQHVTNSRPKWGAVGTYSSMPRHVTNTCVTWQELFAIANATGSSGSALLWQGIYYVV